jgi:hypothetical protein
VWYLVWYWCSRYSLLALLSLECFEFSFFPLSFPFLSPFFPPSPRFPFSGTNDPEMSFQGTLNDVNLAFEWLTYDTVLNENGPDAITIVVNDTGQTGAHGNAHVTTNTIDVWIDAENDAPVVTAAVNNGVAQATRDLDNLLPVITVDDIDVGDAPLEITLRVRYGRVTLNSLRGLSFGGHRGHGTGVMDRQLVFYGDLRAVNDALRGMQYICRSVADACVSNTDAITVQVRDLDQGGDNGLTTKFIMDVVIREPTIDEVQGSSV